MTWIWASIAEPNRQNTKIQTGVEFLATVACHIPEVPMNPSNTLQLVKSCPIFFALRSQGPAVSSMCWGIECDDGWNDLIADCVREIEALSRTRGIAVRGLQIKEKFAGLRIYYQVEPSSERSIRDEVDRIIAVATKRAAETCEICGGPGRLAESRKWYKTLCAEHLSRQAIDRYRLDHAEGGHDADPSIESTDPEQRRRAAAALAWIDQIRAAAAEKAEDFVWCQAGTQP